jgi:hypothetical protein
MNAGATAPTGMALNVSKRIISLAQAETMGITKAYDTAQSVLCNYHISEFFRRNPNGVLWLRLVAQGLTMTAMLAPANTYTKTLLAEADGKIQMLGVCMNPASFYNPNITNGLDIDVGTAIQNAQQLVVDERDNHRPIHVFIEGRSFTGLAANVLDLRNLTLAAPNVSVFCLFMLNTRQWVRCSVTTRQPPYTSGRTGQRVLKASPRVAVSPKLV